MSAPVVAVDLTASVGDAVALLLQDDFHHLVVTESGRPRGVICGCDLASAPAGAPVGRFMSTPALVILESADIDQAATLLKEARVGCLPVVAHEGIVGIVTRSDLRRAGALPPLDLARCESCGSTHHLRETRTEVVLCIDCRTEAGSHTEAELGDGD
jgi:signal-transduction protein with cAMP-binding, CBS, and nucleotidyltransferase domain